MSEILETLEIGRLRLATAVRSGPWVFLNGRRVSALAGVADRKSVPHPNWAEPHCQREAEEVLAHVKNTLQAAGCEASDVVRLDQYYPDWRVVPHYHSARRRIFDGAIPASTSVLEPGLLQPGGHIELEAIARRKGDGEGYRFITPSGLEVSPHMGFSPIVETPELVFFAGQMAEQGNSGIAPEAKVPPTHLWKGDAIRLETEYIIWEKVQPSLDAVGKHCKDVIKAQIYLSDVSDAAAFLEVWRSWFDGTPPATTIVPTSKPGFNCPDASVEINLIVASDGSVKRFDEAEYPALYRNLPHAVESSGLLFLSGLMALEDDGLAMEARVDGAAPYFFSRAEAQAEHIIARADAICAAAEYRLEDAVRIIQFHTDLREFYAAAQAWQRRFGGQPVPLTAVQVPEPLTVPGGTILADIWVGSWGAT